MPERLQRLRNIRDKPSKSSGLLDVRFAPAYGANYSTAKFLCGRAEKFFAGRQTNITCANICNFRCNVLQYVQVASKRAILRFLYLLPKKDIRTQRGTKLEFLW